MSLICQQAVLAGQVANLAAINPYEVSRETNRLLGEFVKTVWIHCELKTLTERDTKGLYCRVRGYWYPPVAPIFSYWLTSQQLYKQNKVWKT